MPRGNLMLPDRVHHPHAKPPVQKLRPGSWSLGQCSVWGVWHSSIPALGKGREAAEVEWAQGWEQRLEAAAETKSCGPGDLQLVTMAAWRQVPDGEKSKRMRGGGRRKDSKAGPGCIV